MGVTALRPVDYADERMCDALRPEGGTPMTIGVEALEVTYDLLQVTAEQIERELSELDIALSDKWGEKLQRDFIRYLERCELGDLEIRDVRSVTFGARRRQPRASYTAWKRAGTAYR